MSAIEGRRSKRSRNVGRLVVALIAAAAVACGGASGTTLDGTAAPAVSVSNNRALLELQNGLPAGNDAGWYTQRLTALDYQIVTLRQESDGVSVFHVSKSGRDYRVQVVMEDGGARARSVEIAPAAVLLEGDPAAGPAVDPQHGVDAQEDTARRGYADEGVATPDAAARSAGVAEGPEFRESPVVQPAASPRAEPEVEPRPEAASAPRAPVAVARRPEPVVEPAAPAPAPPLPEPRSYTVSVPAGTRIATRLDGELSSAHAQVGDGFAMRVADAVWIDGVEVVPAGATVWGYVAEVERAGRPNKGGRLVLATDNVQVGGDALALDAVVSADGERLEGRDSAREDVKEVAIGAGLGGLVGGLLGGKKGVLVGVLAGGGGTFVATKGEEIEIPRDTALSLELRRDLTVTFVDTE